MNKYESIIRYPGSKQNIAEWIIERFPEQGSYKTYLEPFVGSGSIIMNKEVDPIETINDIDDCIYQLFRIIREDGEELNKLIEKLYFTPYSRMSYMMNWADPRTVDPVERVRQFLVRTWQGHGFRTNEYKVGWKSDVAGRERAYTIKQWNELPEKILRVVDRFKKVQIESMDAIDLIDRYDKKDVFMYLDPPYLLDTRKGKQYMHEMDRIDHIKLLNKIKDSKAKIMISGYQSDLYEKELKGWQKSGIGATANFGKQKREVIWTNYEHIEQMKFII